MADDAALALHAGRAVSQSMAEASASDSPLELTTVLRLSREFTGEIDLERLVHSFVTVMLDYAAAERALLILFQRGEPRVEAVATKGQNGVEATMPRTPISPSSLPSTVVQHVIRSRSHVLLEDASSWHAYATDPYLREHRPESLLCLPLVKQDALVGVAYLENPRTPTVFLPAGLTMLEVLADQAAVSLENAGLYADLQRENAERRRAEAELRRSEAYRAEAQRLSLTGSFGWSASRQALFYSDETYAILGFDPGTTPTIQQIIERIHPDDLDHVRDTARRGISEGRSWDYQHRYIMPDGSVKHLHVLASAVRDASGNLEYLGAVMDVTAQRESRQALERAFRDVQAAKDEFRLAIDTIPGLVWTALPDGYIDFLNQRWCDYTGLKLEDAVGWGWMSAVCPEDLSGLMDTWRGVLASRAPGEAIARLRRVDGQDRWFLFRAVPLCNERGDVIKWFGQTTDIEHRIRAEALLAGEKRLLEMIAKGVALPVVLDALCRLVEETSHGFMAAVLLLDAKGDRLLHGAAPSLPAEFTQAIHGRVAGADFGPCGAAADRVEPIIVSDIQLEHRWSDYCELASTFGLRACWSHPVLSQDGKVLGTFAVYSRTPGSPTPEQRNVIEQIVSLASIAIERAQAEDALRRSEAYQAEAQRLSLTGSFNWDVTNGDITWSDETYRIYGFDRTVKPSLDLARQRVHPADIALFNATAAGATTEARALVFAHRLLMPDGTVKHIQVVATGIRDKAGRLKEYVGAVRDITERKLAERALRRARMRGLEARYVAMMEERTRLAREIHDTVLQGFNGVALMLMAAAGKVHEPPEAVTALQHVLDLAEKTLGDARRAVWDLRMPSIGGDFSANVRLAAEDAVRGTGITLEFDSRGTPRLLEPRAEEVAFRVVQEAIANTIKHAGAQTVRVRVSYERQRVRLSIQDDGRGFAVDPDFRAYGGHWGLLGMRERASQVYARVKIRSIEGVGTKVTLVLV